jgi:demethylmenaquinone methyltransferase/2-methoxy-6-polyprenyl-1,4-benzoquinol methylase
MSAQVRDMFAAIASRYDTGNQVLSFGIHRYWRWVAVKSGALRGGEKVLDCATGTGDLAMAFRTAVGPQGSVKGTDFCKEMLDLAPQKARDAGLDISYEVADAMNLPYADGTYDVASISFGIRNVDDPVKCLTEMARVVKKGGRVVVLEFGQPQGFFGVLFRFYSNVILPRIGGLISGNRSAYEYLNRTSAKFPSGDAFLKLMQQSGAYSSWSATSLTFGTAYVYVGVVA